jgi:hypothetical protein
MAKVSAASNSGNETRGGGGKVSIRSGDGATKGGGGKVSIKGK